MNNDDLNIWISKEMSFATNSDFLIPLSMQPNVVANTHLIFKTINSVSLKKFKFEIPKIYAIRLQMYNN